MLFCAPCWTLTDHTAAVVKWSEEKIHSPVFFRSSSWFKFILNPKIVTIIIIIIRDYFFIAISILGCRFEGRVCATDERQSYPWVCLPARARA